MYTHTHTHTRMRTRTHMRARTHTCTQNTFVIGILQSIHGRIPSFELCSYVSTGQLVIPLSVSIYLQPLPHCKLQSMKATQNYHNGHTKFKFSMTIVVILYDIYTLEFAVHVFFNSINYNQTQYEVGKYLSQSTGDFL